jgi:uncharacterized protein YggE
MRITAYLAMTMILIAPAYGDQSQCSSSTGRSISVSGTSIQHLKPDRVTFSVGVQTHGLSVTEAFDATTSRINQVIDALKKKGVTPEEIQTSSFNVRTIPASRDRARSFQVSSQITVNRADITSVGDLIQTAIDAGANLTGGLQFYVANDKAVRKHGLELAFQDARSKAETLAALSKQTLGKAVYVSDESTSPMVTRPRSAFMAQTASTPQIEPGLEDRTYRVSVVFEMK